MTVDFSFASKQHQPLATSQPVAIFSHNKLAPATANRTELECLCLITGLLHIETSARDTYVLHNLGYAVHIVYQVLPIHLVNDEAKQLGFEHDRYSISYL